MRDALFVPHSKPWITEEDRASVYSILDSGMVARGALARAFEDEVVGYNNSEGGISCPSATAALVLALRSLNVGPDSDVIIPTYVCSSVLHAVQSVHARPIICDIGEGTWNMTPESVQPFVTRRVAAIVAVHIFGIVCDVEGLKEFGFPVIEDCAQAFGAELSGKKAGNMGDYGIYSFNATKCLTTGEGGMVVTADPENMARLKDAKERHDTLYPLSDLQAALGLSQLKRYDQFLKRRSIMASYYFENLPNGVTAQLRGQQKANIFFRFPMYGDINFEGFKTRMAHHGVQVRKGVDTLLHRQLGLDDTSYPNAVKTFEKTISLPIYPATNRKEMRHILSAVRQSLS